MFDNAVAIQILTRSYHNSTVAVFLQVIVKSDLPETLHLMEVMSKTMEDLLFTTCFTGFIVMASYSMELRARIIHAEVLLSVELIKTP